MKLFTKIFIVYYTIGTLLLPFGNFSYLPNIFGIIGTYIQSEFEDMTLSEFFTYYHQNAGKIFDKHSNSENQKSHKTFPHKNHNLTFNNFYLKENYNEIAFLEIKADTPASNFIYLTGHPSKIFHPPKFFAHLYS